MPCDVCGHTVQKVAGGGAEDVRWFWCPRCGTMIEDLGDVWRSYESPSLVNRIRDAQNKGCLSISEERIVMLPEVWNWIAEAVGMEKVT